MSRPPVDFKLPFTSWAAPLIDRVQRSSGIEVVNLAEDWQQVGYYSSVRLDVGGDARIMGSAPLKALSVVCNDIKDAVHRLGIDTSGLIQLSSEKMENGTLVYVDGVEVGFIDRSGIEQQNPLWGFTINFKAGVTNSQVETILHALNYTNGGPTDQDIEHLDFNIILTDAQESTYYNFGGLTVAPLNMSVLSSFKDTIEGKDGDEIIGATVGVFEPDDHIDAKGGTDILFLQADDPDSSSYNNFDLHLLGSLKGVEILQASGGADNITIRQDQLEDVQIINGGDGWSNKVHIIGSDIDLRGKLFSLIHAIVVDEGATVTFDNKEQALLALSGGANTHVILKGIAFSEGEKAMLRERGIDMISDDADLYPLLKLENIDGDTVTASVDETVRVDAGSNASLINGKGDPLYMIFYIASGFEEEDRLGIATENTGISLSDGMNFGSVISIETSTGTKIIGHIVEPEEADPAEIWIDFDPGATNADAQALIRALTYTRSGSNGSALQKSIGIYLEDRDGESAWPKITINVEPQTVPQITNLDGDNISTTRGTTVLLDVDSNAVVTDDDPFYMAVRRYNAQAGDHFGILTEGTGISVSDGIISIGSGTNAVAIGEVTNTDAWTLEFHFYEETTAAQVQALIRALTYTNAAAAGDAAYEHEITIYLEDEQGDSSFSTVTVSVDPSANPSKNLTTGIDHITGDGTAEVFQATMGSINVGDELDGGGGIDTLQLTGGGNFALNLLGDLSHVEIIQGSAADDTIVIGNAQLVDVREIRGGSQNRDVLWIDGDADLSNVETITGFEFIAFHGDGTTITVDDWNIAQLIEGYSTQRDTLVVNTIELTDDQIMMLHRRGIDTIVNKSVPSTHHAPKVEELSGDHVTVAAGQPIFLDKDQNATITADDGLLGYLRIALKGTSSEHEHLGIDTNGKIELSDGFAPGSKVRVKTNAGLVEIGTIDANASDKIFGITFNANATPALVQELIHALTYVHDTGVLMAPRTIEIILMDAGLRPRVMSVTVDPQQPDGTPTDIALTGAVAPREKSVAGTKVCDLAATDPDGTGPFTYELIGTAGGRFKISADGKSILVADGALLDYEAAQSHTIRVRVTDGDNKSFEKDFTIRVLDVLETVPGATRSKNKLTGSIGADKINGGFGNDTLSGQGSKDVFVFDTKLGTSKTDRQVNFDTITDFKRGEDKIWLDNKIFKKIGFGSLSKPGVLNKSFFKKTKATDKNDYLIYKSGILSFDADGSGKKYAPVEFLKIANKAALTSTDILVI